MAANVEKAFDFAQESTKQILSLSTAILTITVAFQSDIVGQVPGGDRWALKVAWIAYMIAILGGLLTLLNLAGNLERPTGGQPSIYSYGIIVFSILQLVAFGVGVVFTLWFGLIAF
jgi:hypothetical protein